MKQRTGADLIVLMMVGMELMMVGTAGMAGMPGQPVLKAGADLNQEELCPERSCTMTGIVGKMIGC
jgi:hypothetical protein